MLFTLAFGVQWSKTWVTLKATPSYLQDLFYKNVSPNESDYDLTTQPANKAAAVKVVDNAETNANASDEKEASVQSETAQPQSTTTRHDAVAERLFADVLAKEQSRPEPVADTPVANTQNFEHTLEQAHKLERDSQRLVATGEVWRALQRDDASHKQEIDALLRAADDSTEIEQVPAHEQFQQTISQVHQNQPSSKQDLHGLDWNDDEIFDELLAAVPNSKTATDVHTPFVQDHHVEAEPTSQSVNIANETSSNISNLNQSPKNLANEQVFEDFDDLLIDEDIAPTEPVRASSYAQSSAFVQAPIQTTIQADKLSKEEFIEAWQETAGKPQENADFDEDDFDFDTPLTDASGRPMSRAMQVAKKRLDLPTLPGLDLLDKVDPNKKVNFTEEQLSRLSELLEIKLQEFNVKAQVVEAQPGPVVTRFELDLAPGVKASKVTNISRDLARSMSMASVRVVEVIPGKPYIGIEVPNSAREMVRLIELLETPTYRDPSALISMAMGKDISGNPVLTDLAKAPHMLVAGTTGSGKSVAVNSMILSMLLKYTPDQLRLILIDPKQLELANYNDIPHLLTPVVTDMKDAVSALNWCVNEMERRYKLMSFLKIRKLSDYNRKVEEAIANGEDLIDPTWKPSDSATQERAPRLTPLPSIVIVADEFADMIMQVGKKAEEMITRLAQKSRAAGIHLLLATQRPSVDVITGLIKANIPTRVALRVNSKIDSRTILDAGGAEDLLGHGDMLFLGPGKIEPERVHGAFISDDEVNRICDAWRERGEPDYIDEILTPFDEEPASRGFEEGEGGSDRDALYDQCVSFVLETRKASTSSLQRKFSLGYNRAARIIDQMEENGIVSSMGPNGKRDILV